MREAVCVSCAKIRLWGALAALIIMVLFGLGQVQGLSHAYAAGGSPRFGLQPVYYDPKNPVTLSYFVFNGRPATRLQNSVRVINFGSVRGTVSLYPVDAFTATESGTAFYSHKDPLHDVGAWVTLGSHLLTLAPGQSQIVPFQVVVPGNVRPGQHVGGIVAENLTPQSQISGIVKVQVQQFRILAVEVNLPGPQTEALTATGIRNDEASRYQRVLVTLNNTGNTLLKPSGSLKIFSQDHHLVQNLPLKLDTVLPQNTIDYPVYILHRALDAGQYQASLVLTYGHGLSLTYSTSFTVQPPPSSKTPPSVLPDLVTAGAVNKNFFSQLAPWQYVVGILVLLLLVSGLAFWAFSLYRMAVRLRQRSQPEVGGEVFLGTPRPSLVSSPQKQRRGKEKL